MINRWFGATVVGAAPNNGGAAISDYTVQRSADGSEWTTLNDGVNSATGYTATGLTGGTRYYFRVLAENEAGTGPWSNVANAVAQISSIGGTFADRDTGQPFRNPYTAMDRFRHKRWRRDRRLHHPAIGYRHIGMGDNLRRRAHDHPSHGHRF